MLVPVSEQTLQIYTPNFTTAGHKGTALTSLPDFTNISSLFSRLHSALKMDAKQDLLKMKLNETLDSEKTFPHASQTHIRNSWSQVQKALTRYSS